MEMKKLVKGLTAAALIAISGSAFAATQGTLGGTSSGTVDITVDVGDQILITGLVDITGSYVPGSDFTGSSPACVYRNGGAGDFDVQIDSANGTGADFRLQDGGVFVVYDVTFDDGASGPIDMNHAQNNNTNFTNADLTSPTCGGAPQSTIAIDVPDANLGAVGAGSYQDTLTILVAPR